MDPMFPRNEREEAQRREFEALFRRSHKRAYHLARRLLGDAEEAADVTQDAYVRAWSRFSGYDRARSFEGWLFRIVNNLVIDRCRHRKRLQMVSLDAPIGRDEEGMSVHYECSDGSLEPETRLLAGEINEALQNALAALPRDYRTVMVLAEVYDCSYQEIALLMRSPLGTVRSRVHRARLMLRRMLEEAGYRPVRTPRPDYVVA